MVHYLDFDLAFSSLVQNLPESEFDILSKRLRIIQPKETLIGRTVISALALMAKGEGFIILDSLNMMQNLIALESAPPDLTIANRKSSVLISLIQQIARNRQKTILVLSLTKSRPKRLDDNSIVWEKELVGGRMMKLKSDVTLLLKESNVASPSQTLFPRSMVSAREILVTTSVGETEPYRIAPEDW